MLHIEILRLIVLELTIQLLYCFISIGFQSKMKKIPTSKDPLLSENKQKETCYTKLNDIVISILKGIENALDWSPLITVQVMNGSYDPVDSLGGGTIAASIVILISFLKYLCKHREDGINASEFRPKTLDLGQFILFGMLWLLAFRYRKNEYVGNFLVLWFNSFTTGGIGIIMWISVLREKPFVIEFAENKVPPNVWKQISSKKWFRLMLTKVAMFWVNIIAAMTAIVSIQPFLVTFFYNGKVNSSMNVLGNILTGGQFLILFYGIYQSAQSTSNQERNKKLVRKIKENGLDPKKLQLYGPPVDKVVSGIKTSNSTNQVYAHQIKSLRSELDLNQAGHILRDAFAHDTLLDYLKDDEAKLSFFTSNVKSVSYFNHVYGCYDGESKIFDMYNNDEEIGISHKENLRCVMACIPVFTRSQEEIDIYNSYGAWVEHGFRKPISSEGDIPLPDDDLFALGYMKKNHDELSKRPYIYIAYFGTDPIYKGKGYGGTLLEFIVNKSEEKEMPLVLETTNAENIGLYKKYGFEIVDHVEGKKDWVLMIREIK